MFTGISEVVAEVKGVLRGAGACTEHAECGPPQHDTRKLVIERPVVFTDIRVGSSICVSGVCLTVVELSKKQMSFDVVPETLRCTTLGSLTVGSRVNLERALPATGRFEGHIVQGHIEGVGRVTGYTFQECHPEEARRGGFDYAHHDAARRLEGSGVLLTIALPKPLISFVVEKGSIAIDGVSLTVAKLKGNQCTVALIPHTLKHTTLGSLKKGDRVNVETDVLARYARRACSL